MNIKKAIRNTAAIAAFAGFANQATGQEKSDITQDLEVSCTCAKNELISAKMLYQDNNQLSMFRHTTSTGSVTVFPDAIVKKLTGIKAKQGTPKQKFNTKNNNLSKELSEILDLVVKNGEETCKTQADAKANSEKTILINAGKYPVTLSEEDKNKTIKWFNAIRL